MSTTHYSMIIEWSDEDQAFIVTVPELPGCRTHGDTYEEAVQQGIDAIEGWIEVAKDMGWSLPTPKKFAA
jgi:antitoxin HicB